MTKHPSKTISVTLTCTYHRVPFKVHELVKLEDYGGFLRLVTKDKTIHVLDKWQMGDIRLSLHRK